MPEIKVALIREGKVPVDRRVTLTPQQAVELQKKFPHVKVYCQRSEHRCFTDSQYEELGIPLVDDVSHCDIMLGVKEVPIPELIADKTYLFFSHTIKKQAYNKTLLQEILRKNICLIDYERLTNEKGNRIVAFGRFAGIVGAYNGLYTYGKKSGLYDIRRAKDCYDLEDLKIEYAKVKLPPIKIALTGAGRVARGAMEVMNGVGIRKVSPKEYLEQNFDESVYAQLFVTDYNLKRGGGDFSRQEFFKYPEQFEPGFQPYTQMTDLFIAGAFWDHRAPVLFFREDMLEDNFQIKVIADITCDIEGSIPSTKRPTTIENPVYDYDPQEDKVVEEPFTDSRYVSVMAIDNLPSELPRDASRSFGENLIRYVFPNLFGKDDGMIARATIAKEGKLTEPYLYLTDYVEGEA
ncbi:saccharopine dehydrogenase (NAD+, L-lysine-forming) [Catalinimonas alkaloidigena]|uniref:NAD(P)-dependent oxidoreductase n=1 Tax=Catalinimonas alkaloidigena TaxID=1075417 RepID=UPI0024067964|nr:NAD(P)-dependent oxidoreductase [Catalinimonas alkaloidigena]MDF9800402.1 saccharopine dehydrogenase (NAD+, L-lysine-forming) [Catalinimonas alkaloidigena]